MVVSVKWYSAVLTELLKKVHPGEAVYKDVVQIDE